MSDEQQSLIFQLNGYRIDLGDNTVTSHQQVRHVEPKAMQVLSVLVDFAGQTVSREYLLQTLWPDRVVVEEVLTRAVSQLRQSLDDSRDRKLIQTVPKKGYRLTVQPEKTSMSATDQPRDEVSSTRTERTVWAPLLFIGTIIIAVVLGSLGGDIDQSSGALTPARLMIIPVIDGELEEDQRQLFQGLTEDLTSQLSSVSNLQVASRYAGISPSLPEQDIQSVATERSVRYPVVIRIRDTQEGPRAIISLFDVSTDSLLWSGVYDSVFARLNAVRNDVINQLLGAIPGSSEKAEALANQVDPDAYRYYLRGRYWIMNGTTSEWFFRAVSAFKRAIQIEPEMTDAYAALAYIYARYNFHDVYAEDAEARERASELIDTALSQDPYSIGAHQARAIIATQLGEFSVAQEALDLIITHHGADATTLYLKSELAIAMLEPERALQFALQAKKLDPLSQWVNVNLAIVHIWRGEYKQAEQALSTAMKIDKNYTWAYVWQAKLAELTHQPERAEQLMEMCLDIDGQSVINNVYSGTLKLENSDIAGASSMFNQAAMLAGDSPTARFWKSGTDFLGQGDEKETALALIEQQPKFYSPVVSLAATAASLYISSQQGQRGLNWFERNDGNYLIAIPQNWPYIAAYKRLLVSAIQNNDTEALQAKLQLTEKKLAALGKAFPTHIKRNGLAIAITADS